MLDDQILVEPAPEPTDSDLKTVSVLVQRLAAAQQHKERLEEELKAQNKLVQQLAEIDLPEAMNAVGHTAPTNIRIAGYQIDFSEKYRCGQMSDQPSKDGKNPANHEGLRWLEDEGHGDLIKRQIGVALPKESTEAATEILDFLRKHRSANSFKIASANSVHPQTLAAFTREQYEAGNSPPLETLRVQRVKSVKVVS